MTGESLPDAKDGAIMRDAAITIVLIIAICELRFI
jgi:hypothetical protein